MVRTSRSDDGMPGRGHCALVLAGPDEYAHRRALTDLADVSPLHANVLAVTYDRDAEEWLADWPERVAGRPAETVVLSPGEFTRSTPAAAASTREFPGQVTVEAIEDPADLSTLGDCARAYLSRWRTESRHAVVLFEDVTGLLAHVPSRTAFGFLHLLAHETRNTGALGWFYADPDAHSPATVGVIADLFDGVVRRDADGWQSRREYHPPDGAVPTSNGAADAFEPDSIDWHTYDEE